MKYQAKALCASLAATLMFAAGCATKQDLVKTDDAVAPAAAAPAAAPAPSAPAVPVEKAAAATPAPPPAAPAAAPAPTAAAGELQSALQAIYFGFDASTLSKEATETLARNAELLLKKSPGAVIRIEGNCDERGSDEYNLALGEKRAKAAKNYLVTLGVSAERLTTISYGKEKPLDQGHSEAAWAKNRRDDFTLVAK